MATTYNVLTVDTRTDQPLAEAAGCASPFEAGRQVAEQWEALIGDGYRREHFDLRGVVAEDGDTRTFTDAEQAAMVAALDQFMAEHRED